MALILEEEKSSSNTLAYIAVGVVALGFILGAYFLFFSPAPLVQEILPSNIQRISTISNAKFNVGPIVGSPIYASANSSSTIGAPVVGQTGKNNPFVK